MENVPTHLRSRRNNFSFQNRKDQDDCNMIDTIKQCDEGSKHVHCNDTGSVNKQAHGKIQWSKSISLDGSYVR